MNIDISYYSSIGSRNENEDSISVLESGNTLLALIADGLGGYGGGSKASKCAISVINSTLQNVTISDDAITNAIKYANKQILQLHTKEMKMKTTIAALWLSRNNAVIANVGDTRIYHIRDNKIIYQSIDHSVAQMAVYTGEITLEQIRGYKERNKLTKALGVDKNIKPYIHNVSVEKGDVFLLCSDGFWEIITEEEIINVLNTTSNLKEWLDSMHFNITKSQNKNIDNNSAIVLKIE